MVIALSGPTGFIGWELIRKAVELGWLVKKISREDFMMPDREFMEQKIEGVDAVINLAGAPVSGRWTPEFKQEILDSRVATTRKISQAILDAGKKPPVFISTSAVGIYDSSGTHTETSTAFADSFLATVCRGWEEEAMKTAGVTRLVILRIGMVLGKGGGALEKMYKPFSIGLGGKIGDGRQPVSFIHLADLAEAIVFIIGNQALSGVINAVSPYPTTNYEFTDKLGKVLNQPAFLRIPAFALKMIYGEGAQVLLEGQRVLPEKLEQAGFRFRYPTIQNALFQVYR
jgi:uncharacterized protein (TIGR01777 family)